MGAVIDHVVYKLILALQTYRYWREPALVSSTYFNPQQREQ